MFGWTPLTPDRPACLTRSRGPVLVFRPEGKREPWTPPVALPGPADVRDSGVKPADRGRGPVRLAPSPARF